MKNSNQIVQTSNNMGTGKGMLKTFKKILCYTLILSLLLQNNVRTAEARTNEGASTERTLEKADETTAEAAAETTTQIAAEISAGETDIAASEDSTPDMEGADVQPEIISEIEEKRDTFSKEYFLSDNSRVLAVYPEPIHYETESGDLAEIDNSLTRTEEGYANGSNSYEVVITDNPDGTPPKIRRCDIRHHKLPIRHRRPHHRSHPECQEHKLWIWSLR